MRHAKTLIFSLAVMLICTVNTNAQTQITVQDIDRFGWEYLDQEVKVYVLLYDVYACLQPSNRGKVCGYMYHGDEWYSGLFSRKLTSSDIRPFIGTCVEMQGTVIEADRQIEGAMVSSPTLEIESMEVVGGENCTIY